MRKGWPGLLSSGFLVLAMASAAVAEERLTFIGVALDVETRQADRLLQDYLHRRADVDFAPEELDYGRVIERLANWSPVDGDYLARTTPYVYLASEMLGADFEILGTYVSATTGQRTYSAYLVVRRDEFPVQPELNDVIRYLRRRPAPARFVYHNEFSTSSYLLPALLFRSQNIFNMPERTESLTAIRSERIEENSSTALVRMVARGEADLAAVWDGTKAKFDPDGPDGMAEEYGKNVYFVRLSAALPNDLLVCSASLDLEVKERVRAAIRSMGPEEIGEGDFNSWQEIREASDTRLALADLRWLARPGTNPVTVEVDVGEPGGARAVAEEFLEAARQAVRLSESEFVLFDEDFHEHIDYRWTLRLIHDGAVELRSAIPGSELADQVFQISFRDVDDLLKRISSLLHVRLHRIRYVWPYSQDTPIVLRDTPYSTTAGSIAKVQRIEWLDQQRNDYRAGPLFEARIRDVGFFWYRLHADDFPESSAAGIGLDAMSNVSYRVVLIRPEQEPPLFRALTLMFLVLLLVAFVGAVFDLRRGPRVTDAQSGGSGPGRWHREGTDRT